ncbi:MAG: hypothetical protein IKN04_04130 [Clostridia bacterium]|nr:hypothetical protein [Clostridia bacterium]
MYVDIKDQAQMTPEQQAEETTRVLRELVFKLNRELEEMKQMIEELQKDDEKIHR